MGLRLLPAVVLQPGVHFHWAGPDRHATATLSQRELQAVLRPLKCAAGAWQGFRAWRHLLLQHTVGQSRKSLDIAKMEFEHEVTRDSIASLEKNVSDMQDQAGCDQLEV